MSDVFIHFAPLRDRIRTGTVAAFFGRPIQVSSWTETWICDCKLECHFRDLFICFISDQCEESAEGWIIDDHLFLRVKVFFPVVEWMKHRPVDMRRALCFIEQTNPRHFDSLILERRPLGGLGSGARHYWFNSFSSWPLVLNELLRLDLLLAAKWRRHQGRSRPLDVTPSICSCSKFWLLKIFKIKKFIENSVRPNHSITEL